MKFTGQKNKGGGLYMDKFDLFTKMQQVISTIHSEDLSEDKIAAIDKELDRLSGMVDKTITTATVKKNNAKA